MIMKTALLVSLSFVLACGGEPPPHETPLASASASSQTSAKPPWPVAEKKPVTNTYQGKNVVDDYQWLEDSKDPAVIAWSDAENAYARSVLESAPGRDAIHTEVQKLLGASSPDWYDLSFAGKKLFAMKQQP